MLISLIQTYGYWAILLGTALEGETVLLLGGVVAHRGYLHLYPVILAAFIGALLGDQFWFYIGRTHGKAWLARRPRWQATMARWQGPLTRHQTSCTIFFRFLYGFRSVAPVALAMSGMPTTRFVVLNTIGAGIWSTTVTCFGYVLGDATQRLLGDIKRYELVAAGGIIVVSTALWIWRRFRDRCRAQYGQA